MLDWLGTVLTSTVVTTALVSLIIYLFQNMLVERMRLAVKNEYDEKLATHQATLKAESDVAQEKLRAQLQIDSAQANITFSRLHERRFEAIELIYGKLRVVYSAVEAYGSTATQEDTARQQVVIDAIKAFNEVYLPKEVLLSHPLEEAIAPIEKNLRVLASNLQFSRMKQDDHGFQIFLAAHTEITEQLPGVFAALRRQIRSELGDAYAEQS